MMLSPVFGIQVSVLMKQGKKNSFEDAVEALRSAMHLLELKSRQKADAGTCVWVAPSGEKITARLTPEDCEKIKGAVFIGLTE